MEISLAQLKKDTEIEGSYLTTLQIDHRAISVRLDPDDVTIEETILLANKILGNFDIYKQQAEDVIVRDFLDNYNENWADDEDDFPTLDESGFRKNLTLNAINFLSKTSVDLFYDENGMFGNHSLIAQSFDGENFEDSQMFG